MTPAADIIVINWNSVRHTLECLDAVFAQRDAVEDCVVTVVDNGSTDGSIGAITSKFPAVRFLPLGSNRGFTGGLEAGLLSSTARNVIFLNNDAIPEPGWLAAMVRAIDDAPPDVMSIAGRIIDLSGHLIDFVSGSMTFDGHAFQTGFRMPIDALAEQPAGSELLFACGGNMISRRVPLVELGGFDDDYFAYLEDVDFGWRSWLAGWRVLWEPAATVRHASSATSDRLGNFERGVLFERNALQTVIKNAEHLSDFAGAVLFSYLHRLHYYTTTRNTAVRELTRSPFSGVVPKARANGLLARIRRRLFGATPLASLDDPLTTMQFRALDWILSHQDRLAAKRAAVQKVRKRTDAEIFSRFPLHIVPTYPGDDRLMSSPLFRELLPELTSVDRKLGEIIRT